MEETQLLKGRLRQADRHSVIAVDSTHSHNEREKSQRNEQSEGHADHEHNQVAPLQRKKPVSGLIEHGDEMPVDCRSLSRTFLQQVLPSPLSVDALFMKKFTFLSQADRGGHNNAFRDFRRLALEFI